MAATALGPAGAAAQEPSGEATVQDVVVRDELIAAQESLLNTYRCLFSVDVEVVPGGCADGQPALGPTRPGVFEGTASRQDVAVRDELVANQEALLNVYRCLFGVDTQIVPGGCVDGRPAGPVEPERPPQQVVVVPGPEDRAVLAQQSVGAAGAVVSGGRVSVSVPAGAIDGRAEVVIREPLGEFGDEVGGEPVGVERSGPVRAPITVRWDVSNLSELQQQVLVLVRWDDQVQDWVPEEADYRIDDGVLTAEIQQWSLWGWITDPVIKAGEVAVKAAKKVVEVAEVAIDKAVEAVDELVELGESAVQTALEVAGARVDTPECASGALPSWVEQATESDEGTTAAAIRMCYENGPGESVRAKMANNRTFAQFIEIKGGDGYLRPVLSGVDSTLGGLAWSVAHSAFSDEQRVFVPPLATVQVDIPRPAAPGDHTIGFKNLAEAEALVADAAVFVVETLDPLGALDSDTLAAAVDVLIECAQDQLKGAGTPSFSQIAGHVADCFVDIPKPGTDANSLFQQKLQDKAEESAASTVLDEALDSVKRKSRTVRKAVKYLVLIEIAFYGLDLLHQGIKGLTTWNITGQGGTRHGPQMLDTTRGQVAGDCRIMADQTIACHSERYDPLPQGTYTKIDNGGALFCGLRTDQTLDCYNHRPIDRECSNDRESGDCAREFMADVPSGQFTDFDIGFRSICAIRIDKTVHCWGRVWDLECLDNLEFDPTIQDREFSVGISSIYGIPAVGNLRDCNVYLSGNHNRRTAPRGQFSKISASSRENYDWCGIKGTAPFENNLECWGRFWYTPPKLYHPRAGFRDPTPMTPPSGTFIDLDGDCALTADNYPYCWTFINVEETMPTSISWRQAYQNETGRSAPETTLVRSRSWRRLPTPPIQFDNIQMAETRWYHHGYGLACGNSSPRLVCWQIQVAISEDVLTIHTLRIPVSSFTISSLGHRHIFAIGLDDSFFRHSLFDRRSGLSWIIRNGQSTGCRAPLDPRQPPACSVNNMEPDITYLKVPHTS